MVLIDSLVAFDMNEVLIQTQLTVEIVSRNGNGLIFSKSACGALHDGESLRQNLVQCLLDGIVLILNQFVAFLGQFDLLRNRQVLVELGLDLGYAVLERSLHIYHMLPQAGRMSTQFVV